VNTLTNIGSNGVSGFIEDLTLVRIPPWWQSPWFIALTLVALAILVFAGRRIYVRWRASHPATAAAASIPSEPAHLVALRKLVALRGKMGALSAYEFTIECSQVLREYIGARFQLAIVFQTTREFLESAHANPALNAEQRARLGDYLHHCDRVKFGQHDMSSEQMAQMLDYAEQFVNASKPNAVESVALRPDASQREASHQARAAS
jgi:hypothetical protein